MNTLRYRTRADSSPNGKPRVYFCCHPEDFPIYFEPLTREILELWDCAVWYIPESGDMPLEDQEMFTDSLLQMQLFVIPVSETFLFKESSARVREFPLAVEQHIPVLPILVDSGLAMDFNRICGNLQFLDRTSTDLTEIPYAEKLKKFLESVLVPDDLSRKIRAAFDAYVFLSYRKKDRKYAQELMRMIHENDFCRDIAIWYDEFLTPGENFNDSIREALEKSRLFALAVTPNLVNEKNYVMDIEYPLALQSGKKILPAELCATDRKLLEQCYEDIPRCVSGSDRASLSDSLVDAFREIAVRENHSSPEHLLFIGLAYLNGIDVEVDHARGLRLIKEAAEQGLAAAMKKLVSMYRTGAGVPLDQDSAVFWQKKLIARLEEQFTQTGGGFEPLLNSLQDLAILYSECQNYPMANEACRKLKEKLDAAGNRLEPDAMTHYILWYYDRLGSGYQAQGLLTEAKKAFLEYENTAFSSAHKDAPTLNDLRRQIISCDRMGQLRLTEGNLAQALHCFRKGKQLTFLLDQALNSVDSLLYVYLLGIQCARTLRQQENLSGALEEYEEALALARRLADDGSSKTARQLSLCLQDISRLYSDMGQYPKALEYAESSFRTEQELTEKEPSVCNLRNLSVICNLCGDIRLNAGPVLSVPDQEILEYYRRSLEIDRQLADRTGSMQSWLDLSHSCDRISRFFGLSRKPEKEKDFLAQAVEAAEQAVSISGAPEAKRALLSHLRRSALLAADDQDTDLEKYYEQKYFDLGREIYEETQSPEDALVLASEYQELSSRAELEQEYQTAREYREKSIRIHEEAFQGDHSSARYQRILANAYRNMAELCQNCKDIPGEREYLEKALKLENTLCQKEPLREKTSLAACCRSLGDNYCKEGDWNSAWDYYRYYIKLHETQKDGQSEADFYSQVADAWAHCAYQAQICAPRSRYCIACYNMARTLFRQECCIRKLAYAQEKDNIALYDNLLRVYRHLAELCLLQKDLPLARYYAEFCCKMARRLTAAFPHTPTYLQHSLPEYAGICIRLLMKIFYDQGKHFKEEEDYEYAEKAFESAIHYGEVFLELFPDDRDGRNRLALLNYAYGDVLPDGYYAYYLEQALRLWEHLAQEYPEDAEYAHNIQILKNILKE